MLLGWFALIAQFYLSLENRTAAAGEAVVRFFSYFTILSNGFIAIAYTMILLRPGASLSRYLARPAVLTALTLYIVVVGLVYNVVLRSLWSPKGLQMVVDELLHSLAPALFLVFWIVCVPKVLMRWKHVLVWMIFPLAYCIYSLIRGAIVGWYPYPFLDAGALGYPAVAINIGGVVLLFFVLAFLLVWISKLLGAEDLVE
jgi:hypothetical protein